MLGAGGERHGELAPRFEAEGHRGVDALAHLDLRCAGTAGDQRAELAGGFASEVFDPAEVDPRRRRSIEPELPVCGWVKDCRLLRGAIHGREIRMAARAGVLMIRHPPGMR